MKKAKLLTTSFGEEYSYKNQASDNMKIQYMRRIFSYAIIELFRWTVYENTGDRWRGLYW